jgi:hypothetical protein
MLVEEEGNDLGERNWKEEINKEEDTSVAGREIFAGGHG